MPEEKTLQSIIQEMYNAGYGVVSLEMEILSASADNLEFSVGEKRYSVVGDRIFLVDGSSAVLEEVSAPVGIEAGLPAASDEEAVATVGGDTEPAGDAELEEAAPADAGAAEPVTEEQRLIDLRFSQVMADFAADDIQPAEDQPLEGPTIFLLLNGDEVVATGSLAELEEQAIAKRNETAS